MLLRRTENVSPEVKQAKKQPDSNWLVSIPASTAQQDARHVPIRNCLGKEKVGGGECGIVRRVLSMELF